MLSYKKFFKSAVVMTFCVGIAACSAKHTAGVENSLGVETQGLESDGPFLNSDAMARLIGIDKNTIYFAFDKSYVSPDFQYVVDANAKYLKNHASARVRLEGNTDPRGSREYNIGLGQRRASSVAQQLEMLGVSPNQIVTVSYGQERPGMPGHTEEAYRLDRRVDIVYMSK